MQRSYSSGSGQICGMQGSSSSGSGQICGMQGSTSTDLLSQVKNQEGDWTPHSSSVSSYSRESASQQAENDTAMDLIAISHMAKMCSRTKEAEFREAIRLQFDSHQAMYNLETVLHGLAEDTLRIGVSGNGKDMPPSELHSESAIYTAAAHSLKPSYSVCRNAVRLVRSMLPLPHLKVGYLTAPPLGNSLAPHSDWKRTEFELNHERLLQVLKPEPSETGRNMSGKSEALKVNITEIVSVTPCADLTLVYPLVPVSAFIPFMAQFSWLQIHGRR
ncbi:PREDICTED: uncharacterized protein LOC104747760 [Camelina sativa]|uniref:Uncharacterized protein LOC104747760 n=1 Tax=Camelina sativa TaxID=90675 RepID=A0ABM0W9S8_CAMSA|nr:PREDICTED: uncharacterized protein LOC104747760 [Camelina sativa]